MSSVIHVPEHAQLQQLRRALQHKDTAAITEQLSEVEAADAAELLTQISAKQCLQALATLPEKVAAKIIASFDEETMHAQLRAMSPTQLVTYLPHLASDDAADLLMMFSEEDQKAVLEALSDEEKTHHIEELLHYDENTAGGLMAKELISCQPSQSVASCLQLLRSRIQAGVGKFFTIYVLDTQGTLLGALSLHKLLSSEESALIETLYKPCTAVATPYTHKREVADLMRKYDLETLPVASAKGRLLGRITVDDILDVQKEIAEEEQGLMAGLSDYVESHDRLLRMLWARLPWLLVGMGGGFLAAHLMSLFKGSPVIIPALIFFVPLLTATAGNVGIQSALSIVQTLSHGQTQGRWLWPLLWRLWWVAVFSAALLATVLAAAILLLYHSTDLAVTIGLSLCVTVLVAALLGTLVPLLLHRLGMNPVLATGPFLTTLNDLVGIGIYLLLANWLYSIV